MGLTIGKIRVEHFPPPQGVASDLVEELMEDASWNHYMAGEGRAWGYFCRSKIMRIAGRLVTERGYTAIQRAEIDAWIDSLPWDLEWQGEKYIDLYFED